ncbi:preprotein translocase, SecY subunit [Emticicia oligotrophica DSM 17448]|uniref:Protein translocase subunit SecY n=1 Tax=Emticicia oligotrophica (strain DSM 17448 / CIP 109782 / MTCC 6937 / GPTSA100-15) TaxID=929562 RepID=A0ABN4AEW8_EMTOG|nr:preprotein translocase subunit SecY [Emticicia oligotrophica]AFK01649.1 preprotein translocase, SecY subunit [Emticicia oligotrophica DSM 17448]
MNKFITTLRNIWSIEELRKRILNTILIILVFRIGSHVVLPGVDVAKLKDLTQSNGLLGLLNTLVGGAFQNASVMALGIMPYISASIAIQLLTLALPYFSKLQKEGESGRRKLNQITRWLTIIVAAAQAFTYVRATISTDAITINQGLFYFSSVILIVSGTVMCMWLGERMTEKGVGNGISMMIMIGIVSRFPGAIIGEAQSRGGNGQILFFVLEIVALFLVVLFAVAITQATRRIPVQYAKQIVGNKVVTGQRQYLPLKLNIAGVMPIIFGQALMFIPGLVLTYLAESTKSDTFQSWAIVMNSPTSWQYCVIYAILIIGFTFFYTAISINPNQIADDMKRGGGFIPGVKPGQPTSDFVADVLDRITLPGGVLLAVIAILPAFAGLLGMTQGFASFFGGTSLLILVGVVLDTLQQIESYLLMKRYEGLMQSGRIQGRQVDANVPA